MTKLDIVGQIADMKEIEYKNTLAIASIIELLIDKGVISKNDIAKKALALENMSFEGLEPAPDNVRSLKRK